MSQVIVSNDIIFIKNLQRELNYQLFEISFYAFSFVLPKLYKYFGTRLCCNIY